MKRAGTDPPSRRRLGAHGRCVGQRRDCALCDSGGQGLLSAAAVDALRIGVLPRATLCQWPGCGIQAAKRTADLVPLAHASVSMR